MTSRLLRSVIPTFALLVVAHAAAGPVRAALTYPIVDTGVTAFYDNDSVMPAPKPGEPFYGQDAQYRVNPPSYTDNGDGTVTDNVTGLMWQKAMGEVPRGRSP